MQESVESLISQFTTVPLYLNFVTCPRISIIDLRMPRKHPHFQSPSERGVLTSRELPRRKLCIPLLERWRCRPSPTRWGRLHGGTTCRNQFDDKGKSSWRRYSTGVTQRCLGVTGEQVLSDPCCGGQRYVALDIKASRESTRRQGKKK